MIKTSPLGRRGFLGLGLGAAAVAATGCGSNAGGGAGPGAKQPYTPPAHTETPALPGAIVSKEPGVPIGYESLPEKLIKSVDAPPGRGGPMTHVHVTWGAPVPALEQNKWWQGLNERLNVDFQMSTIPYAEYEAKFATLIAGGDLPDVIQLMNLASCAKAARQGAFADLSDVLAGDKILEYKNLSNVRPDQWKASAIGGRIYGVPIDIPAVQTQYRLRKDWAEKLGFPDDPKNAEELAEVLAAISKGQPEPGRKVWGGGGYSFTSTIGTVANAMFRVPNNWRLEGEKLVHAYETPEYEQAVDWAAKLFKAGGLHPDTLALGANSAKDLELIGTGQVGLCSISAQNWYFPNVYSEAVKASGGGLAPFIPPGHDGSVEALFVRSSGSYGINAISAKVAEDKERLAEILRVFNYRRAPYASEEWYYLKYGAPGDYYHEREPGKDPEPIEGNTIETDRGALNYGLAPQAWQFKGVDECIKINEQMVRTAEPDPTQGLTSDTRERREPQLKLLQEDFVNRIVVGERPMTDLKEFVEQWRSQGGDQMRTELETALKEQPA